MPSNGVGGGIEGIDILIYESIFGVSIGGIDNSASVRTSLTLRTTLSWLSQHTWARYEASTYKPNSITLTYLSVLIDSCKTLVIRLLGPISPHNTEHSLSSDPTGDVHYFENNSFCFFPETFHNMVS